MRLQLAAAAAIAGVLALAPAARADGSLTARGVYYKERSTRVMQPMLDAMFDAGSHGVVTGHFLVDAITSASASSGAADAKPFSERRYEGGLGYSHVLDALTLGGEAKLSTESDYRSVYLAGRGQLELNQKNTVVGLGGGLSLDQVSAASTQGPGMITLRCDADHLTEKDCGLTVYSGYGSLSQLLSPDAVLGISVDVSTLRGFQANPYREAIVGESFVPERHPTKRTREAFAASLRYYLAASRTTLIGAYRYYRDDWKVHAHTPELRVVQELGLAIDASLRYRYYTQDGAYFFRDRYPADDDAMTQFVTDDVKLSSFTSHIFEAKAGVLGERFGLDGRWAAARLEAIFEYAKQNNRFGNAVIAHVALTIPFTY